ncbi:STY4851/ECs_5259 family protein [Chondromyces apiculatus]|uniref:Uncharacterized protein n=1 Tax=Chondromyces apiculatus DSM 436 TaxID=1192034 RepID=A0A017TJ80_9BACT|nr:STY4851/ECs_5259 family protein [Chondromyces apiculatus]EYF08671.1 Hypothetical protein CAP_2532 [Chondromyces apiculatus DSM 436]
MKEGGGGKKEQSDALVSDLRTLVRQILANHGLVAPDQRPLYAYRVDEATLHALQTALTSRLSARHRLDDDESAAALSLFAATYFCRTYQGGAWSWRDVLAALDHQGSYTVLYEPVERGLAYWRRSLLVAAHHRGFLLTLACEGGLPLKVLQAPERESHIKRYFRELVRVSEAYNRPAADIVARHADVLPVSLHNDLVLELSANLVDAVVKLRKCVRGQADPIHTLDTCLPEWRKSVPLHLDDDVAREFLDGLLRAPREPTTAEEPGLLVDTLLRTEGSLRVERRLGGPPDLAAAKLAEQLQISEEDLPARLYLHLVTADGERRLCAIATASVAGEGRYDLQLLASRPIDHTAVVQGGVLLVAAVGGRDIACIQLPGGEALDNVPWIFEGHEQHPTHVLVGVGAYRTRAESIIAVVATTEVLAPEPGARVEDWGEIAGLDRVVKRVEGSVQCKGAEESFVIATRQPSAYAVRFILRGKPWWSASTSAEAWLGPPQIKEVGADGTERWVPPDAIEWRPRRSGAPWQRLDATALGAGKIRVIRGGEQVFRTSCTILPPDFDLRIHPKDGGGGHIRVESRALADVGVIGPGGDVARKEHAEAGVNVTLQAPATPPAFVDVWLRFRGGGEARFNVPYPARVVVFSGRGGVALRNGDRVSLDGLSLVRARAVSPVRQERFALEARLEGSTWIPIQPLHVVGNGCFELPLDVVRDTLRAVLASCDELDHTVSLRIVGTQATAPCMLRVGWYEASLEKRDSPDGSSTLFLADDARRVLGDDVVERLRLVTRPLLEPEAPDLELPSENGRWSFVPQGKVVGPWLLLGLQGDTLRLRPLRITVKGEEAPESTSLLERAARIKQMQARQRAFSEVVETLAGDFGHPDWPRMQSFLRTLGVWPASTLDAVRALASHPGASAVALLKASSNDFDRLWDGLEQLSLLWSLIPICAWLRAARQLLRWVTSKPQFREALDWSTSRAVSELLANFAACGPQRARFLAVVTELIHLTLLGMPPQPGGSTLGHSDALHARLSSSERPALLRRHTHDTWPAWEVRQAAVIYRVPNSLLEPELLLPEFPCRDGIINAPALAAAISMHGITTDDTLRFHMRRLRAFDETWFDVAHATALTRMIARKLKEDPGYFNAL